MANKKINQLVSKTAILSTDFFGIGDATTGQLFKKTIAELQAAIGGAVISVNGLVGTVVLDTDDIQELATPTNKYFTDARARGAISLTVTGNSGASTYSSGTGVLNVPTYTLAGLGGISLSSLSGTNGISYNSATGVISYSGTVYTDASIRALLSGGTGISYNSSTGAISYSGTVYTDSSVRALISLTTTGTSGASTYNNTTGVINVPEYTLAGLGGISLTSLSGGTGITYNSSTGGISYSGTVYTDASVRALISATGSVSYNNTTGVITSSITQYTDALARASVSLTTTGTSGASTYNLTTGVFNIPQYAAAFSGTSGYHAKFTSSTTIGNSVIYDDGTSVGIGTASPNTLLTIAGTNQAIGAAFNTYGNLLIYSTDSHAQNKGGSISLGGKYNSAGTPIATFARIHGKKENTTVDSTSGYLSFETVPEATALLTERMRITSSGSVAIGTNAPDNRVHIVSASVSTAGLLVTGGSSIQGDATSGQILLGNTAANRGQIAYGNLTGYVYIENTWANNDGDIRFRTKTSGTAIDAVTIKGSGLVGINQNSPSAKIHVSGGDRGTGIRVDSSSNASIALYNSVGGREYQIFSQSNGDFSIYEEIGGEYRFKLFNNGNIAIGTTANNGYKLYVSGTIYATGNITANSDLTLKKNLELITNPTDKLMQLNGYSYQWKSDDSHQYGVVAQEVEKILPYAVSTGNDGIKGVSYNQIIPVLIEAVKEQKAKIENLEILLAFK